MEAPATVFAGCTENASMAGGPTDRMSNAVLVPPVSTGDDAAVSVYAAPARLIESVENVATPPTAATPRVPPNAALAVPVAGVIETVIVLVSLVTTLPPASSTATRIDPIT